MSQFASLLRDNYRHLTKLSDDFQIPVLVVKEWVLGNKEPHQHLQKAVYDYLLEKQSSARIISPLVSQRVRDVFAQSDPLGFIKNGGNYEDEIKCILRSLPLCTSMIDLTEVIWATFILKLSPSSAGEPSSYRRIAEDIWKVWKPDQPISTYLEDNAVQSK